jgi:hypothetical protein
MEAPRQNKSFLIVPVFRGDDLLREYLAALARPMLEKEAFAKKPSAAPSLLCSTAGGQPCVRSAEQVMAVR